MRLGFERLGNHICFTIAALAVVAIVRLAPIQVELGAPSLSMIRTAVICGVALAFGGPGSHGKRADLGRLAYSAVALGTLKLFREDLRFGKAAFGPSLRSGFPLLLFLWAHSDPYPPVLGTLQVRFCSRHHF